MGGVRLTNHSLIPFLALAIVLSLAHTHTLTQTLTLTDSRSHTLTLLHRCTFAWAGGSGRRIAEGALWTSGLEEFQISGFGACKNLLTEVEGLRFGIQG